MGHVVVCVCVCDGNRTNQLLSDNTGVCLCMSPTSFTSSVIVVTLSTYLCVLKNEEGMVLASLVTFQEVEQRNE